MCESRIIHSSMVDLLYTQLLIDLCYLFFFILMDVLYIKIYFRI